MDKDLHELIHILVQIDNLSQRVHILVDKLNQKDSSRELHEKAIKIMLDKRGRTLTDILQVTGMFILLILPFVLVKLWWWVWMWGAVLGIFAAFEIASYVVTKRTLSQQFGKFKREHPVEGWLILGSMILGWGFLILHLM